MHKDTYNAAMLAVKMIREGVEHDNAVGRAWKFLQPETGGYLLGFEVMEIERAIGEYFDRHPGQIGKYSNAGQGKYVCNYTPSGKVISVGGQTVSGKDGAKLFVHRTYENVRNEYGGTGKMARGDAYGRVFNDYDAAQRFAFSRGYVMEYRTPKWCPFCRTIHKAPFKSGYFHKKENRYIMDGYTKAYSLCPVTNQIIGWNKVKYDIVSLVATEGDMSETRYKVAACDAVMHTVLEAQERMTKIGADHDSIRIYPSEGVNDEPIDKNISVTELADILNDWVNASA